MKVYQLFIHAPEGEPDAEVLEHAIGDVRLRRQAHRLRVMRKKRLRGASC